MSHCREILPPGHKYLRCERHRVQNRHHSKLKRVRDKESKARVVASWVATRLGQPSESTEAALTQSQISASDSDMEHDASETSERDQNHADTQIPRPSSSVTVRFHREYSSEY